MSKKLIIIITAAVGLLSFGGMFALAWLTKPAVEADPTVTGLLAGDLKLTLPDIGAGGDGVSADIKMKRAMNEKQLKGLISEVREKIEEYKVKLKDLGLREQRLLTAQDTIKKDIEEFANLRIELASAVQALKKAKDELEKSTIKIATSEKTNLMSLAAAYDKMDSASAGEILTNISNSQSSNSEDAVKILHYMTGRTKAKVLASIAKTAPETSAYFCQQLKQIIEKE